MENSLVFISSEHYLFDRLNATYLNGIYFDGMTQDHFNYDCCGVIQGSIRPGIFDCRILDYPNPCKAFIWECKNSNLFWRGFVVDINDAAAIQKAEDAYNERKQIL